MSRRRSWIKSALRLLGPVILLVVLLRVDRVALFAAVARLALGPLAVALLLSAVAVAIKVERWRFLLRAQGYRYAARRAYAAYLSAAYLGMITPGRVGDVLRIQYTKHDLDMPYSEGLAIVVMDRVAEVYVLLAFVAVGVAHYAKVLSTQLATVAWGGVAVTALGPLILFIPGLAERVFGRIYDRVAKEKHQGGLDAFLHALRGQVGPRLAGLVPLAALPFLVNYTQGWLLGQALGLALPWFEVMCMLAVTSLLGLLPISVAGVGVREAFLAVVFPTIGLLPGEGVAFGMSILLVLYVAVAIIGFISWQIAPPPVAVREGVPGAEA